MRILDISPTLRASTAVWPGDTPFSRQVALSFSAGDNLTLSAMTTTLHVGAHADAPSHYHPQGQSIEQRPLERYYGPCQVIQVACPPGARIQIADLPGPILAPRVLFRTDSFPDPDHYSTDFVSLSPALVHHLHTQGVVLVGLDTPSVDPMTSKSLESHGALYQCDMAVLEGVILASVQPGLYTLVAFPLKIEGADASPVRAVLLSDRDDPALQRAERLRAAE